MQVEYLWLCAFCICIFVSAYLWARLPVERVSCAKSSWRWLSLIFRPFYMGQFRLRLAGKQAALFASVFTFFFSSVFQLLCFSPAFCFPLFQLSVFPPFFCPFRLCFCFVCRCPVSVRLFVCLFVCLPFVCAGGLRKGIPNILQRARQRNWIEMIRGLWVVGRGRNAMKSDYWRCCFMFYACPPSLCSRPVPLSLSLSCEWSTHGTQIIMQKNIYLIDTARGFEWGRGWILHTFLITYFSLWAAKKKSLHLTRFFEALKQGLTVLPYGSCETRRPWAEAQFF